MSKLTSCAIALLSVLFCFNASSSFADIGAGISKDRNIKTAIKAIKKQKFKKAIRYLKKEVKKNPDSADAHNLLGYSYRNTGKTDLALQHYDEALALDPSHKGANEYLGELYLKLNKLKEAEKRLAKLGDVCQSTCEEYKDLEKAIANYKSLNN